MGYWYVRRRRDDLALPAAVGVHDADALGEPDAPEVVVEQVGDLRAVGRPHGMRAVGDDLRRPAVRRVVDQTLVALDPGLAERPVVPVGELPRRALEGRGSRNDRRARRQ